MQGRSDPAWYVCFPAAAAQRFRPSDPEPGIGGLKAALEAPSPPSPQKKAKEVKKKKKPPVSSVLFAALSVPEF